MTQHLWGEDFDWKSLNKACEFFPKHLRRWGRINITSCKEKCGTMRLEWFTWDAHYSEFFQALIYPGNLYVSSPVWFRVFDWKFTALARFLGISWIISQYQRLIFNIITVITVKKWPHIQGEITDDYEFQKLLYRFVKKYLHYEDHWR